MSDNFDRDILNAELDIKINMEKEEDFPSLSPAKAPCLIKASPTDLQNCGIEVAAAESSTSVDNDEQACNIAPVVPIESCLTVARRCQLLIGNLNWWTTDQNITDVMQNCGINDVVEIKFFEHRQNGQSKGYCVVTVGSEKSRQIALEQLPKCDLNGRRPIVKFASKSALMQFEQAVASTRSAIQGQQANPNMTLQHCGFGDISSVNMPQNQFSHSMNMHNNCMEHVAFMHSYPMGGPPIHINPNWYGSNHMPFDFANYNPNRAPPPLPATMNGENSQCNAVGQPVPHFNPDFLHYPNGHAPAFKLTAPNPFAPTGRDSRMRKDFGKNMHQTGFMQNMQNMQGMPTMWFNTNEVERLMNRNRTISRSATIRAVTATTNGDFQSAIETLVRGISLIKNSKMASDERSKSLVMSLESTLEVVQKQMGKKQHSQSNEQEDGNKRGERDSDEPERERERELERKRERERERERSQREIATHERRRKRDESESRDGRDNPNDCGNNYRHGLANHRERSRNHSLPPIQEQRTENSSRHHQRQRQRFDYQRQSEELIGKNDLKSSYYDDDDEDENDVAAHENYGRHRHH